MMDNPNDPSMLQGLEFGAGFPGGFPPQVGFGGNPLNGSGPESISMLDEFSTEDNTLLMSVLNSTPIEQQYSFYVPPAGGQVAVPPPWPDLATPNVAAYAETNSGPNDYSAPYGAFGMGSHGFPPLGGQQGRPQNPSSGLPTKQQQQPPHQANSFSGLPPNIAIKPEPIMHTSSMSFPSMPFPPSGMQMHSQSRPQASNPMAGSPSLSSGYPSMSSPQVVVTSPTEISHESGATSVSAGTRAKEASFFFESNRLLWRPFWAYPTFFDTEPEAQLHKISLYISMSSFLPHFISFRFLPFFVSLVKGPTSLLQPPSSLPTAIF
jgi:hypothetical protein